MGGKGYGSVVLGTFLAGCGPNTGPDPAQPPDPEPIPQPPPADAGPPEPPPAADPLAGKNAEERWRWAVERIPELAGVLRGPDPDFARWLDSRGRVVLYSPNMIPGRVQEVRGYKRCSAIEFLLEKGDLIGRIPHNGKPSRADYAGNHAEITLGLQASSRPVILESDKGNRIGVAGGCGRTQPQLSQNTAEGLRYEGMPVVVKVECKGPIVRRKCKDGSTSDCVPCEPGLTQHDPRRKAASARMLRTEPDSECKPCPPAPLRDELPAVQKVVDEHHFQRRFEGGEMFFRDRAACLAATAPWGAPAREHAHGFPIHPDLYRVCSQHVMGAAGAGAMEIDWSLYASAVTPKVMAKWYQSRLGKALVVEGASWIARIPSADAPDHVLEISAPGGTGPTCGDDAPADTRTLVRVSTAVRR